MQRVLVLPLLLLATPVAAQTGELKSFGDWMVGCDNRLDCTAIGLSPDLAAVFAYLKVSRGAGGESGPIVKVTILDELGTGGTIELGFSGDTLPVTSLEAEGDDSSFASAELGATDHGAFLDALLPGETLDVTLGEETVPVSLTGLSAALRYMDAAQGRAGTQGALVAKGERPADTVPATPPPVVVDALRLTEVSEPGERPAGIEAPQEPCFTDAPDFVVETEAGTRLWGVCVSAGAYNYSYEFWTVEDGTVEPADFGPQGQGFGEDGNQRSVLVNPVLWDDGRTIGAFARGRGLGDCGAIARFALYAEGIQLVEESAMGECRGVNPDDWPVLYRAELSTE